LPTAARPLSVFLVDDSDLVRGKLAELLAALPQVEVSGEAGDVAEAITAIIERRPDVVILDLSLPGGSGLEVLRAVKAGAPTTVVVVLTMHPYSELGSHTLECGADFYFEKDAEFDRLAALMDVLGRQVRGEHRDMATRLPAAGPAVATVTRSAPPADAQPWNRGELLRHIIGNSRDCIKILDLEGRLLWMNDGGQQAMEIEDFESLRNSAWPEWWLGPNYSAALAAVTAARVQGAGTFTAPRHTAKGRLKWWEVIVTPIIDAAGRPEYLLAISRDVTARKEAENTLRDREAQLRAIFDNEPECVKVVSPDGRLMEMNSAGLAMLEAGSLAEAQSQPLIDYVDPAHRPEFRALHQRVFDGENGLIEFELVGLHGGRRWMETHATPLRDATGAVQALLAVTRDITPRRRAEAELNEKRAFFEALANSSMNGILVVNHEGRIIYQNQRAVGLWKIPPPLPAGTERGAQTEFVAPHTRDKRRFEDTIRHVHAHPHESSRDEIELTDGTVLDRYSAPVLDPAGRNYGRIWTFQDITARKRSEVAIREQSDLLNRASDAIVVLNLAYAFTFWNRGAERLFGWSAAETLGHTAPQIFTDLPFSQIEAIRRASMQEGEWRGEVALLDKTGRRLVIALSVTLVRDDAGAPKGLVAICSDLTERRKLEEQFLRTQRLESIGMLAAGIAHDLNNVLAPIMMVAPMLRDHTVDAHDLELISILEKSATRGAGLVRQILGFAHGVGGEPRNVQARHLLDDIVGLINETFPKNIELQDYVPGDLWTVHATPIQLHQVLLNLCVNARDAMPQGGELRLRAENCVLSEAGAAQLPGARPGEWLVLHVEDTGIGIPPETLARMWEPFFTTKPIGKGTGLGLSTVRGIVESHRGFVHVTTAPDRGTTFRVYLPAAEGSVTSTRAAANVPRGNGELVLVVDDEPAIRNLVTSLLTRHGYTVVDAGDGIEAIMVFTARRGEIRLVVTDLDMPRLGGADFIRAIRQFDASIKVVSMSGGAEAAERVADLVDALLGKPFDAETLLTIVHELLGRTAAKSTLGEVSPTPAAP
jgi:PAS domain S-box-containing protein